MTFVDQHKEEFQKAIEHLKHDISNLRTGRATPALVEDIPVEAYGTKQPLKAVASISISDPKTIAVQPWDKSVLAAVESAIRQSPIGVNPVNDGKMIRVPLPDLTQERRIELIKVLHQKLEASRIAVRALREDVKGRIDAAESAKEIGEDEKFRQHEALEKLMKDLNETIKTIGEEKEKEIQTI
jgi:ribosome recycling factor